MNTARSNLAGSGTQTAALFFTGAPVGSNGNLTEKYDGSSWTNGPLLNVVRSLGAGTGTQSAALVSGGGIPGAPSTTSTEEFSQFGQSTETITTS